MRRLLLLPLLALALAAHDDDREHHKDYVVTPEPATWALAGGALVGMAALRYWKRKP